MRRYDEMGRVPKMLWGVTTMRRYDEMVVTPHGVVLT